VDQESRLVHVINIDNYFPELFELTIPTIEFWTRKLRAKLNIITTRKFPDWPILYEKIQIFFDGHDIDWNILLDADILVQPDTPDPLYSNITPNQVAAKDSYHAHMQLKLDDCFYRDGRDIGLSTCTVITHRKCHKLWTPLEMNPQEACEKILIDRMIVDEYTLSRNLAKYGFPLTAPFNPSLHYNNIFHIGAYAQDKNKVLDIAKKWRRKFWN
jgi:hypothetical protein